MSAAVSVDVHHHLLYGMDDGPRRFAESAGMIDHAIQDGMRAIIATPHVCPGVKPFDQDGWEERLIRLNQYCAQKGYDLQILGGAEIRDTESAVRLLSEGRIPTLNGTRFVLVEWSTGVEYAAMARSIREYTNAGYCVVVAHVERYRNLWMKKDAVQALRRSFDVRIQVDCEALLDKGPYFMKRFVKKLLDGDLVDYVATDAHDLSMRRARMTEARAWLSAHLGEDQALALTSRNPMELLLR